MDAIETIRANVSPVVLSATDDSDDDDDNEKEEDDEEEEDGNASEGDGNGKDDLRWLEEDIKKDVNIS